MAAPAVAASTQDVELLALSDRYWALRDQGLELDRSAPGKPHAEWEAIYDRVAELDEEAFEIASQIADMPAFTPGGLAAKLRIIRLEAGFRDDVKLLGSLDNRYEATVALGLWTAREDAERLVGEG